MEKESTLKNLLLQLEKGLRQVEIAKALVKKNADYPVHLAYANQSLKQAERAVEHYNKKIELYGGGTIIEVTGKAWNNFRDLEVPMPFTMYLNCKDEDEARLLLQIGTSQVPKDSLIWETLQFRALNLKSLYF